jgi:2-dehydropantoate 2-reductase
VPEIPRIGLIGGGAVGSLLAASLLAKGAAFQWVVRSPQRRAQLETLAARIDGDLHLLPVPAGTLRAGSGDLQAVDWLVLVVKAQQVPAVLAQLPAGIPALVVANGLHSGRFQLGVLYGGARLDEEGTAHFCTANALWAGPLAAAADAAAAPAAVAGLLDALAAPWLAVEAAADIRPRMWHKLALNCVVNPLTALLDCPNGGLEPHLESPLVRAVLTEAAALGALELGAGADPLRPEALVADLRELVQATAGNSSSMREDLRRGRESEIGALNLAVARQGATRGRPCPVNQALASAVSTIEEANRAR